MTKKARKKAREWSGLRYILENNIRTDEKMQTKHKIIHSWLIYAHAYRNSNEIENKIHSHAWQHESNHICEKETGGK